MEIIDVVDSHGRAIGQVPRDKAHREGLLHREVHVWLYTPRGELIWQQRSKTKETFAGFLDATVGGHISAGEDWLESAVRELEEETGLKVQPRQLKYIGEVRSSAFDKTSGLTNNVIRRLYALKFDGKLSDLVIEDGEISGFELWPIKKLFSLSDAEKSRFIPSLLEPQEMSIYRKILAETTLHSGH